MGASSGLLNRQREVPMARSPTDPKSLRESVLEKMRDLAEQVRRTAERVHQQAIESHRLTEIARQQSDRGRELSRAGKEEARSVRHSVGWSVDSANEAHRRLSRKDRN
jgi:methyl-accepting chemotaxis protein